MKPKALCIKNISTINVELLKDESSIREAKALDDLVFIEHQGITLYEITAVAEQGGLLAIRNSDGKLIAEAQIIFHSIPGICDLETGTALCYGSAVHPSYRKLGLGQTLMKAKEKLASDRHIKRLILTVRPENAPAIMLWQKCGFSIYGYDANYFGERIEDGRLLMEKILEAESKSNIENPDENEAYKIQVRTEPKPDIQARRKLATLAGNNYVPIDYKTLSNELAFITIHKR